jgi:isochorismate synthase EntC
MEVIDTLEPGARGVYSGSVGFFSVNGRAGTFHHVTLQVKTPLDDSQYKHSPCNIVHLTPGSDSPTLFCSQNTNDDTQYKWSM